MNKFKIFSIALLTSVTLSYGQDIEQAKKAIDAEQFEKAKTILKAVIQSNPKDGNADFFLGTIYLTQSVADSAKVCFDRGLLKEENSKFNYIGLGQMELDKNNLTAAQNNFALVLKESKKKDIEPYIYIAKAYMNAEKPDYSNALVTLNKAMAYKPTDANLQLVLGDAYYGLKNQNDAYVAYRNAFQADPTLIRAKMQLGVLLKGARAFSEAVKAYDNVVSTNPEYGPVYRELAETYYFWANSDLKNYKIHIKKALEFYEKYMSLTDYSLASRMRHADFLILAKDYVALEVEAKKMKELDNVNPRILRYLGYAAYENGNTEAAIGALENYIGNPKNKIIARDYLYLGLAKLKLANNAETKTVDLDVFNLGVSHIKKSVELEITMTNDLSEVGKKFYEQKLFKEAAAIYEIAVTNVNSKNYLLDNFYLGNSLYYNNTKKDVVEPNAEELQKADTAFGNVITASPTTQDAYIFRARANSLLENDPMIIKYYQEYIDVVTAKGPEELEKASTKAKCIESYNSIAAAYANTDKTKAKEYFAKTLEVDPTNEYAIESLKALK